MDRQAAISISLAEGRFELERFEAVERLSQLFVIEAEGFCADDVDFLPQLGAKVSLEVGDQFEHVRYFHGLLTAAELIDVDANGSHYRLTLRPWFYMLDQVRDYKIFQDMSVIDIAKAVFSSLGMSDFVFDKLTGTYAKRDYCVQYKESAFAFLSRLFEDEGIYYYFEHGKSAHKLVLCDGKSAHEAAPHYDTVKLMPVRTGQAPVPDTLSDWSEHVSTGGQSQVSLRSYDFQKPQTSVHVKATAAGKHSGDSLEVYEYLGDFTTSGQGTPRATNRLAALRAERQVFRGVGDLPGVANGGLFTLSNASIHRFNQEYLIIGMRYVAEAEAHRSGETRQCGRVQIEAIPSDIVYRPPMVTPKPTAMGLETATVTGPQAEVIYVDEFGRVKVRFHWDRNPDSPGKTSCWMRVSHHSAGDAFGHVALPRVGQEVVVDFLDGDPDRPIITGRVYNKQREHPYALPANKTRSTWRSQTVGTAGDYTGAETAPSGTGFNEIRFEDKGGSEEIFVHAQREMVTEVQLDDKLTVMRDRKTRIGRDRTTEIKHHEKLTVEEGDETHTVSKGKRTTSIKMDDALTVEQGNLKSTVSQGNVTHTVSMGNMDTAVKMGNYTVKTSMGAVTIEAMQSITLKVGGNSVVIDQTGVTIKGIMVTSEAQAIHKTKGTMTQVEGAAMTMVKGAIVMIN